MKSLFTALIMSFALTAMADPQLGTEYLQTQQAIPTDNPAKIEVTEIFWYGCPHCYHLEPTLAAWVKKLPKDVEFKRIPGIARPDWAPAAKAFYVMEALGIGEKLHGPLFEAIHKLKTVKPDNDAGLIDWITKQSGLDRKKVEEAYNSFSVNTKVNKAAQIFRASGATGVPSLIVEGRYLTSSTIADGNEGALKVTDFLIEKVRQENASHSK